MNIIIPALIVENVYKQQQTMVKDVRFAASGLSDISLSIEECSDRICAEEFLANCSKDSTSPFCVFDLEIRATPDSDMDDVIFDLLRNSSNFAQGCSIVVVTSHGNPDIKKACEQSKDRYARYFRRSSTLSSMNNYEQFIQTLREGMLWVVAHRS
jgi:hypothetical protein